MKRQILSYTQKFSSTQVGASVISQNRNFMSPRVKGLIIPSILTLESLRKGMK